MNNEGKLSNAQFLRLEAGWSDKKAAELNALYPALNELDRMNAGQNVEDSVFSDYDIDNGVSVMELYSASLEGIFNELDAEEIAVREFPGYKNLEESHEEILDIEAIEWSVHYGQEWDVSREGFEAHIENRLSSVVGEYAHSRRMSWDKANELLIQHRIENLGAEDEARMDAEQPVERSVMYTDRIQEGRERIAAQVAELRTEVEDLEDKGYRLMPGRQAQQEMIRRLNDKTLDPVSQEFMDLLDKAAIAGKVQHVDRLEVTLQQQLMQIDTRYVITSEPLVSPAGFNQEEKVFLQTTIAIHCDLMPMTLPECNTALYLNDMENFK